MNRAELLEGLRQIIVNNVKHEDFEMSEELSAPDVFGWDSLTHMIIITDVEEKFGAKLRLRELSKLKNAGTLLDLIESKL